MAFLVSLAAPVIRGLEYLAPLGLLGLRLWVANVFWKSGVNKFQSWDTTLLLFKYEYQVPILDVHTAAALATATELIFPVMLAIGLGGRLAAVVLFVFNIIAVISYPALNPAGIEDHQVWGLMLAVLIFYGPGKLSLDHLMRRKFMG
jgi:putative oxidoreductase